MHALVEAKTCIQCGLCPTICPEVFSLTPGEPAQAIPTPSRMSAASPRRRPPTAAPSPPSTSAHKIADGTCFSENFSLQAVLGMIFYMSA